MSFLDLIPKPILFGLLLALSALSVALGVKVAMLDIALATANGEVARHQTQVALVKQKHEEAINTALEQELAAKSNRDLVERRLQEKADNERKDLNAKLTAITTERDRMRLLYRPHSGVIAADPGGFGSESSLTNPRPTTNYDDLALIPSESEFFIGALIEEASRADTVRESLLGCYAAYESAQKALE